MHADSERDAAVTAMNNARTAETLAKNAAAESNRQSKMFKE